MTQRVRMPVAEALFVGYTCLVFCDGGYPAVLNDTQTLTCAYNSSDNTVSWEGEVPLCLVVAGDINASSRVDFSEYFSLTYNETCAVRSSEGDTGADDRNVTEFYAVAMVTFRVPWSVRRRWRNCSPFECWSSACCLGTITSFRQTVTCQELRCQPQLHVVEEQRGRVEESSRKWRTKRFCNIKWLVSDVSYEVVHALNPGAGGWESPSYTSVWSAKVFGELAEPVEVFQSKAGDGNEARRFIIRVSAQEVLERHASEAIRRFDIWSPRL